MHRCSDDHLENVVQGIDDQGTFCRPPSLNEDMLSHAFGQKGKKKKDH